MGFPKRPHVNQKTHAFFSPLGQKFKVPVWSAELSEKQRKNFPLTAFVAAFVPSSPLLPHIHSASWPGTETLKNPTPVTFINGKLFSSHWVVDGNFKTQSKPVLLKTTQAPCLSDVTNPVFALDCHYVMSEQLGRISGEWDWAHLALRVVHPWCLFSRISSPVFTLACIAFMSRYPKHPVWPPQRRSCHETQGALVNFVMTDGRDIKVPLWAFIRGLCALKISVSQICNGTVQRGEDSECQNTPVPDIVLPGPQKLHIALWSQPHFPPDISDHCILCLQMYSGFLHHRTQGVPSG